MPVQQFHSVNFCQNLRDKGFLFAIGSITFVTDNIHENIFIADSTADHLLELMFPVYYPYYFSRFSSASNDWVLSYLIRVIRCWYEKHVEIIIENRWKIYIKYTKFRRTINKQDTNCKSVKETILLKLQMKHRKTESKIWLLEAKKVETELQGSSNCIIF